ncbi:hypothetical protein HNQ94_003376 [Salirhabdus euzebyi]|uniref:NETI motif-containing protein n=1 Tax=Salirhabdus euzebyi TaxID=394506 RepID=A0A841Q9G3_9BACI|nr:NETI motif-containing protein [Salirhabdus euzebyi]MBB6454887.1 hypothetical protein [Salirhabdus euzebyi]
MSNKPKKKKFYVEDDETIEACLNRIEKDGYQAVKRLEKPIFKEVKKGNKIDVEPAGREIIFEARLLEQ